MSLMIHTIVPSGIVVSADTRTTCKDKDKGKVRYSDTAEKIIIFPNKIIVSHCGDANISKELNVTDFLLQIKTKFGKQSTINDLPLRILSEYRMLGGQGDTKFLISGYYDNAPFACTYRVETKDNQITVSMKHKEYGASYSGVTSIAHSIMNSGINYSTLSIEEAIELSECCLNTIITVSKFQKEQLVGGKCQTYVIDRGHDKIGWFKNGEIMIDNMFE